MQSMLSTIHTVNDSVGKTIMKINFSTDVVQYLKKKLTLYGFNLVSGCISTSDFIPGTNLDRYSNTSTNSLVDCSLLSSMPSGIY